MLIKSGVVAAGLGRQSRELRSMSWAGWAREGLESTASEIGRTTEREGMEK